MSDEQKTEFEYRVQERLAIMCGKEQPTNEQLKTAEREAWLAIMSIKEDNQ